MGLVATSVRAILTPSGRRDWRYLDGNDGVASIPIAFFQPPDIRGVQEGTTPTFSISDYISAPGGATITLNVGTTFGGWTYNGSTSITFGGTGIASTIVRSTVTYLGTAYPSPYTFIVETVASASSDSTPPTIPTGVTAVSQAAGILVAWRQSCDQLVTTASNVKEYDVLRAGVAVHTTAAGGTGITPKLIGFDIGAVEGAGSTVQDSGSSGSNYSITSKGVGFGGTADAGQVAYWQQTGNFRFEFLAQNLTGSVDSTSQITIAILESLTSGSRGLFHRVNQGGVRTRQRATLNAATTTTGANITGVTWPLRLCVEKAGDVYTTSYSLDGKSYNAVAQTTLALSASLYLCIFPGSGGGGTVVADCRQVCIQSLPNLSWLDTITDGAPHTYTIKARDNSLNVSDVSASVTATAPSVADSTPPSVPTGLTGTATSSSTLNFSCTASPEADTRGYIFSVSTTLGGTYTDQTEQTGTTFSITGLAASTQRFVKVRAIDTSNNASANTAAANATTQAAGGADTTPPTVPTGVGASGISTTAIRVTCSGLSTDTQSGISRYRLYVSAAAAGPFVLATGDPVITGFPFDYTVGGNPNTGWFFQLSALDGATPANESVRSGTFSATTLAANGALVAQFLWENGIAQPPGLQTSTNTTGGTAHWKRESVGPTSTPANLIVHPGNHNPPSSQAFHMKLQRKTANDDFRVEDEWTNEVPNRTPHCYGFAIYPTSNWNYAKTTIVFQTHHVNVDPFAVQPPFAFYVKDFEWGFWTIWHRDPYNGQQYVPSFPTLNRQTTNFSSTVNRSVYGDAFHLLTLNAWTAFEIELCFDSDGLDPGNVGYQKIWKNDVLVVNRVAPMGIGPRKDAQGNPTIENQNNAKFGAYAVKGDTFTVGADTMEHYLSPWRIARGAGRRLDVAA